MNVPFIDRRSVNPMPKCSVVIKKVLSGISSQDPMVTIYYQSKVRELAALRMG